MRESEVSTSVVKCIEV